jgi:MarR family transcriptional regulator, organic hydroperoxide resistance regulator
MQEYEILISTLREWMEVFMRRSMQNFIQFAKEHDLSMSQVSAMFHIMRKGSSGVSEIGEDLGVTSAAASQMLERLVQQGYVLRTEDPGDRRLKQIVLTEKGIMILKEGIQARQKWLDDLAKALSAAEQEQAAASLRLLIERAKSFEQRSDEDLSGYQNLVRSKPN